MPRLASICTTPAITIEVTLRQTNSGNLAGAAPLTRTGINKGYERMDTTCGSKRSSYTKSDGQLKRARTNEVSEISSIMQSTLNAPGKFDRLLVA